MKIRMEPTRTLRGRDGEQLTAEFGRIEVPENRHDPGSRTIELAFARLRSNAREPAPPVFWLEGGPGVPCLGRLDETDGLERWRYLLDAGDVILFDHRGCGRSAPSLRSKWHGDAPLDFFLEHGRALGHALAMSARARETLLERGVDLSGYTSVQAAADVDDLRRVLGLDRVSLAGFSYGAQLALELLRQRGPAIERVVLAGVEGTDHAWKLPLSLDLHLRRLGELAGAVPAADGGMADLFSRLARALERLEDDPLVVGIDDRKTGGRIELPVGRFGLSLLLARHAGDSGALPWLPRLLHEIERGESGVLRWLARRRFGEALAVNGMSMLTDGASGASHERCVRIRAEAERSLFGNTMNFPFPEIGAVWNPPDLGAAYRSPVVSDVPALFLAGSLDWNSPPHQAAEVRWGFARSALVTVENAGHEQILEHPGARSIAVDFLRGRDVTETAPPAYPPLRFAPLSGCPPPA